MTIERNPIHKLTFRFALIRASSDDWVVAHFFTEGHRFLGDQTVQSIGLNNGNIAAHRLIDD
jgi:hypothetical protein